MEASRLKKIVSECDAHFVTVCDVHEALGEEDSAIATFPDCLHKNARNVNHRLQNRADDGIIILDIKAFPRFGNANQQLRRNVS